MTDYQFFKQELAEKFEAEGCCFTAKDIIKVKASKNSFSFYIREYNHIVYTVSIMREEDSFCAEKWGELFGTIDTSDSDGIFCEWYRDTTRALHSMALYLGYRIAQTY